MLTIQSNLTKKTNDVLALGEVSVGKIYLAKFRFNSKTITWQPCRVVSTEVEPTPNGSWQCIKVEFLNPARESWVYVNELNGQVLLMDGGRDPSLKAVTKSWVEQEHKKAIQEMAALNQRLDVIDAVLAEVNTDAE